MPANLVLSQGMLGTSRKRLASSGLLFGLISVCTTGRDDCAAMTVSSSAERSTIRVPAKGCRRKPRRPLRTGAISNPSGELVEPWKTRGAAVLRQAQDEGGAHGWPQSLPLERVGEPIALGLARDTAQRPLLLVGRRGFRMHAGHRPRQGAPYQRLGRHRS